MNSLHDASKPYVAIFLDIDGVLGPAKELTEDESKKKKEIIKKLVQDPYHAFGCKRCNSCSSAEAFLFKTEVLEPFHNLIEKISEVANVHIVISSTWRTGRSVDDLKAIFHMHKFSKHIIDKTIDSKISFHEWQGHCTFPHLEISDENCMLENNLDRWPTPKELEAFIYKHWECRASEINRWIKLHPEYVAFTILDDLDEHLSINFGNKFISTLHPEGAILKPEDTKKAYQVIMNQLGYSS